MNVFQRRIDLNTIGNLPLCEYNAGQLTAYLTTNYPGDPKGMLKCLKDNMEIGTVLYEQTKLLLEALNVKRD